MSLLLHDMKITFNNVSKSFLPAMTVAAMLFPAKTQQETKPLCNNVIYSYIEANKKVPDIFEDLNIVADTNFAGGITYHYDNSSIQKLKERIQKPDSVLDFKAPIENASNIYLDPFGYFFANRPNGELKRPHMGLDIYISPYSRKPKIPVLIQSPVEGVIISNKKARKEDNVIGNSVILLGADGRKYGFEHMARPDDYEDSIPMPPVGTKMKAGDPIGYAGSTGETTMWHLHFTVMTDEALEKQLNSNYWKTLASLSGYSKLRGQVNPLSKKDAGPIAELLSKYRGGRLNLTGDFNLEENIEKLNKKSCSN